MPTFAGLLLLMPARPARLMPAVDCGDSNAAVGVASTTPAAGPTPVHAEPPVPGGAVLSGEVVLVWAKSVTEKARVPTNRSLRTIRPPSWVHYPSELRCPEYRYGCRSVAETGAFGWAKCGQNRGTCNFAFYSPIISALRSRDQR